MSEDKQGKVGVRMLTHITDRSAQYEGDKVYHLDAETAERFKDKGWAEDVEVKHSKSRKLSPEDAAKTPYHEDEAERLMEKGKSAAGGSEQFVPFDGNASPGASVVPKSAVESEADTKSDKHDKSSGKFRR